MKTRPTQELLEKSKEKEKERERKRRERKKEKKKGEGKKEKQKAHKVQRKSLQAPAGGLQGQAPESPTVCSHPNPSRRVLEGRYLMILSTQKTTTDNKHKNRHNTRRTHAKHRAHGTPHNRLTAQAQYLLQGVGGVAGGGDH